MKRMEWFINCYLQTTEKLEVLDVGSYDVNGCYKKLFGPKQFNYIGLDMERGPNVDLVPQSAYKWKELKNDSFDAVISGQALEHIEFFWVTVSEMIRVTKKDGLICIIVPNGFEEHRYPVDCWRFFTDGMVALARFYKLEIKHAHTNSAPTVEDHEWYSEDCSDTMIIAKKPYWGDAKILELEKYICVPEKHQNINNGMENFRAYKESIASKKKNEQVCIATEYKSKKKIEEGLRGMKSLIESMKKSKDRATNKLKKIFGNDK